MGLDEKRHKMSHDLIEELRRQTTDKDFIRRMLLRLNDDGYREEMLKRLKKQDDQSMSQTDIITMVMEITKKADLVLEEFKKLNPNIKL